MTLSESQASYEALMHVSCWNLSRLQTSNVWELLTWKCRWIGRVKQPHHSLFNKDKMAQNGCFQNPKVPLRKLT